jgi:hypothetical protein
VGIGPGEGGIAQQAVVCTTEMAAPVSGDSTPNLVVVVDHASDEIVVSLVFRCLPAGVVTTTQLPP